MDGTTDGSTAWFRKTNPPVDQSANYGVSLDGKITLWIPENCVAYQAGKYSINQISLGIEHEDNGDNTMVRTDALYESSAKLVADIAKFYNIPLDRDHIKKHNEIVATACPGTLDVDRIINRAKEILGQASSPTAPVGDPDGKPPVIITETLFERLVTKSTNWDDVAAFFGFTEDQKRQAGAGKTVVEKLTEMQKELNSKATAPATPPTVPSAGMNVDSATTSSPASDPSNGTQPVPTAPIEPNSPAVQDKSILFQDLSVVFAKLSSLFKRTK